MQLFILKLNEDESFSQYLPEVSEDRKLSGANRTSRDRAGR
jgi:hypothetical protein